MYHVAHATATCPELCYVAVDSDDDAKEATYSCPMDACSRSARSGRRLFEPALAGVHNIISSFDDGIDVLSQRSMLCGTAMHNSNANSVATSIS